MSTWFARQSASMDAGNVWNSAPDGSGSWLTWPPAAGDVLVTNNRTLTAVNVTCAEIRNDTTGGATAGGQLTVSSGVSIVANLHCGAATTYLVNITTSSAVSITGNVYLSGSGYGILHDSACTLTLTGALDLSASTYNLSRTYRMGSSGILNHTGDIVSGGGTALRCSGSGTVNSTGGPAYGGTIAGGESNVALNTDVGTVNLYRDVHAGTADHGARKNSSGIVNIFGHAVGAAYNGSGTKYYAAYNAVWTNGIGVSGLKFGAYGLSPLNDGKFFKISGTAETAWMPDAGGTLRQFTAPELPDEDDVRSGVSYNYGTQTGTLTLPAEAAVSAGVNYGGDGTELTGTAFLTPAQLWDVQTSTLTTVGSVGERLANCATASATAAIVAAAIDAQT